MFPENVRHQFQWWCPRPCVCSTFIKLSQGPSDLGGAQLSTSWTRLEVSGESLVFSDSGGFGGRLSPCWLSEMFKWFLPALWDGKIHQYSCQIEFLFILLTQSDLQDEDVSPSKIWRKVFMLLSSPDCSHQRTVSSSPGNWWHNQQLALWLAAVWRSGDAADHMMLTESVMSSVSR